MESLPYLLTNYPPVTNQLTQIMTNQQGYKLYNPKYEIIKTIFGPLFQHFTSYKISPMWFVFVTIFLILYFTDYRPGEFKHKVQQSPRTLLAA
jgi:hypothetical protein